MRLFLWLSNTVIILIFPFNYDNKLKIFAKSALEKRDVDELEGGTDTHKLFLEQGTLEEKKQKELAEYIDAKNKEVIMTN